MKTIMTVVACVLLMTAAANAIDFDVNEVGIEYQDRTAWRGFALFGGQSSTKSLLRADIGNFFLDAGLRRSNDSGNEKDEQWDFALSYAADLLGMDYEIGYGYYLYPEFDGDHDISEIWTTFSKPVGDFRPRYTLVQAWNTDGIDSGSGALHIFGVDYDIDYADRVISNPKAFVEITYNAGLDLWSDGDVDSEWSHVLVGVNADMQIRGQTIRPGLYWQHTFEESVNSKSDQIWFTLGIVRRF